MQGALVCGLGLRREDWGHGCVKKAVRGGSTWQYTGAMLSDVSEAGDGPASPSSPRPLAGCPVHLRDISVFKTPFNATQREPNAPSRRYAHILLTSAAALMPPPTRRWSRMRPQPQGMSRTVSRKRHSRAPRQSSAVALGPEKEWKERERAEELELPYVCKTLLHKRLRGAPQVKKAGRECSCLS